MREGEEDRRKRLAQALFGIKPADALAALTGSGKGSADEAQRGMARHISTAILADLVQQVQKAWRHMGPGILVIRRVSDDAIWSTISDIREQQRIAESNGDTGMAVVFHGILEELDGIDIEETVLVAITDAASIRVLPIPAVDPARNISRLLAEWND